MESPVHNVGGWLARRAEICGNRPAIIEDARTLDYRALHKRTAFCAAWLKQAGVAPGDRVALVLANRSAYLESLFAAAQIGAIAVPINARLTAHEIRRTLDDCTPRVLIEEASLSPVLDDACATAVEPPTHRLACGSTPDAYEAALASVSPHFEVEPVTPDHPVILMYTSGTTGVPKGALLPHRKALFNSLNAQLFFDLTGRDRILVVLPLFHSFGLSILSIPALYAGATLILHRRFDAGAIWSDVERHGITFFGGVPTMFQQLFDALDAAPSAAHDLASLRFLFTAGAAIPVELIHAFEVRGLRLKQGFGQTETSILCCLDAADAIRKAGSVGRPVFHAELKVVDTKSLEDPPEQWRRCPPGSPGEIVVRGPITMLGYWNRPEASAETLRGEWLRTGDLATVDDEGFLTLVGRARQMYISGGENVYPAEVEAAYAEHPAIRDIAVVGLPDARWGEVGRAYVVLAPRTDLDPAALLEWGAERLAKFKLPAEFVAIESLPRTETGKIQKHRLPGLSVIPGK